MTKQKALQWARWHASNAEANRGAAIDYLTPAQRRTAIQDAQFMTAYWAQRAQEATE